MAVKHFQVASVSAACVAFVELLGGDSVVLRTYVNAGEALLAHRLRATAPVPSERRKEQTRQAEQEVGTCYGCLAQSLLTQNTLEGPRQAQQEVGTGV